MEIFSNDSYLPVDPQCLDHVAKAPCDLFLRVDEDRFALYAGKGIDLNGRIRPDSDLVTHERLFVRREEVRSYYGSLKNYLHALVSSAQVSPQYKAQAVHNATKDIMQQAFCDPLSPVIHEAWDIISASARLIATDDTATRLLLQLTEHDSATYIHCTNVGIFSMALARHFYGAQDFGSLEVMAPAFYFHDLGKCKIPSTILNKPSALNLEERAVIREHPLQGAQMLEQAGFLCPTSHMILLQHHERDDGSGYPSGLNGGDIHPLARICRMADIFEALTAERSYHQGMSAFAALKLMKSEMSDLDRGFFERFVRLFART